MNMPYGEYTSMYQAMTTSSYGTNSSIFQTPSINPGPFYTQGYNSPNPPYLQQGAYTNVPVTIEPWQMRSRWVSETGPHDHQIECRLTVKSVEVVAEYFCFHCNEVLHSKVISRLPASINKKCLPRLVKGV